MRAVVFANGMMADPQAEAARWVRAGDLILAADGGSSHAFAAGLVPRHIIGDLDSLSDAQRDCCRSEGAVFHVSAVDKDETDLELALLWVVAQPEVDEVVVLGAFGGRPDQALANLLLLAMPALRRCRVQMVDRAWITMVLRGEGQITLSGSPGDRVSLIPLGGQVEGVTTEGLVFPLHDEMLLFGPARGVSNQMEGASASVCVRRGLLWCFHERQQDL
ncbi:MAG: thiamine diphosphokinase [Anaerolineae bacterium]|jgi:thiamine pyrophosphokinase|nr:thiamine diphosphokinase [Anaerolineae bacterium]